MSPTWPHQEITNILSTISRHLVVDVVAIGALSVADVVDIGVLNVVAAAVVDIDIHDVADILMLFLFVCVLLLLLDG